jgi:hypothetical protein
MTRTTIRRSTPAVRELTNLGVERMRVERGKSTKRASHHVVFVGPSEQVHAGRFTALLQVVRSEGMALATIK